MWLPGQHSLLYLSVFKRCQIATYTFPCIHQFWSIVILHLLPHYFLIVIRQFTETPLFYLIAKGDFLTLFSKEGRGESIYTEYVGEDVINCHKNACVQALWPGLWSINVTTWLQFLNISRTHKPLEKMPQLSDVSQGLCIFKLRSLTDPLMGYEINLVGHSQH